MKLLSVALARSVWLGHVNDLNPRGIHLPAAVFPWLLQTYKFQKLPPQAIPDSASGITMDIKFERGQFTTTEGDVIDVALSIYRDGLVADSFASTVQTDAFLDNVLTRLAELFNLPDYRQIIRKKTYLSQIYITTDRSLESLLNPRLKQVFKYLAETVEEDVVWQTGGITFWPDQISKINPHPFTIERAVSVPFSEKRYYSAAPLPTDKHIELLAKVEALMS